MALASGLSPALSRHIRAVPLDRADTINAIGAEARKLEIAPCSASQQHTAFPDEGIINCGAVKRKPEMFPG